LKIRRIKIENFRSIKSAEFNLTDFNIFVGQNNSGKTNFFEAIEFFFNGIGKSSEDINSLKYKKGDDLDILVEIEFIDAQDGVDKMKNEKHQGTMRDALENNDTVILRRTSKDIKKRFIVRDGEEIKPGTGFDQALNDFLPKFEYISTRQYYDAVAKYAKNTPIGIMLSGVLSVILEENQQYKEFQDKFKALFENEESLIKKEFDKIGGNIRIYLEKQFPDCKSVSFEVAVPMFDDLLKNFDTSIDDGIETLAEEKGDGMQRALMLAIIQAYADFRKSNADTNKSFLFFIDEAELHLHPTAQRKLKDVLYNLAMSADQVFINTHSSVFLADNSNQQSIFKVEKNEGETSIEKIESTKKPYVIFELLGGSPADLLLPNNFLIVEGKSEFELLTRVIERFYNDKPPIHIIQAKGDIDQVDRTINAIEKAFTPLESSIYSRKLVLLLDKPSEKKQLGVKQFMDNHKYLADNAQIYFLTEQALELCYPDQTCLINTNWKKSLDELERMDGKKKVKLAKEVGDNISQKEFEDSLKICYDALKKAWDNAY